MSKNWYILYVNVGQELRVLNEIERQMQKSPYLEFLGQIKVPTENVVELHKGKKRTLRKTFLSGYVLIELEMPNDRVMWLGLCQFINAITGVKKIVGFDKTKKPIPVSNEEVRYIFERMGEIKTSMSEDASVAFPYLEGDSVRITEGPFSNFTGVIDKINKEKLKVRVSVQIFGRTTPVDLDFNQIVALV